MQEIKDVISEIESELKTSPNDADLLNELAVGYHMLGKYPKAIDLFNKAIELSGNEHKYHFNLGNSYYESDNIEMAINSYMNAIDLKADYVPALNNLADIYELADQQEKARELFKYIVRIKPEDALGYLNLGNHYLRNNNTVEAGKNYQEAISRDPSCYEAYNNIGFILKHLGKFGEAIEYYEQCLEINANYQPAKDDLKSCREQLNQQKG